MKQPLNFSSGFDLAWHSFSEQEVLKRLHTELTGLDEATVLERRREFGLNALPKKKPPSRLLIFLRQFLSPLIYVLIAAGAISVAIGDSKDALFIGLVIVLNAILGTVQEWKAEKSALSLQNLLKTMVRVKREKKIYEIDAEELVCGDIVILESGNKVSADIRILQAKNLLVDESLLTGESVAIAKEVITLEGDYDLHERKNMLFAGTTVISGRCTGVVVKTGIHTEIGKISKAVVDTKGNKPPLVIRMEKFSERISLIVLVACGLFGVAALGKGIGITEVFFLAVALAVSAIPEGLPVALTVALSIATNRMAKRNVIVRKLAAVESLGSCTCIATDKTGTLTVNKQTVKTVWLPSEERFDVTGVGYNDEGNFLLTSGEKISDAAHSRLLELGEAATICNEAQLFKQNDTWEHYGDAVDVALLAMAHKLKLKPPQIKKRIKETATIPFESEIRFAAQFYEENDSTYVVVKGAVETILRHCKTIRKAHGTAPIHLKQIEKMALLLAEEGYRVLAVAKGEVKKPLNKKQDDAYGEDDLPELTFLGLIGLIDPLRTEVKDAIETCKSAGVKVVMVTGDHPATALAIAKELGIAQNPEDIVTGSTLNEIGSPDLPAFLDTVKNAQVFARVTPLQKLYIVEALIKLGHFVAVTGDGVNDAPALRKAHVGVAMGSGTDISKDTASIIITDDNFVSIVAGIEEGRFAYGNVRKVIYLLITTGAAEILLFALSLVAGLPIPLTAVQLLWLNLVTNGIQDVALAFEQGEPGVMSAPPRKPTENIFNSTMLVQTLVAGCTVGLVAFVVWLFFSAAGIEENYARNLLLLLLVLMENFHVFNCRSETASAFKVPLKNNIFLIFGVLGAQGIHILAMFFPPLQGVLQVMPVAIHEWFYLLIVASTILFVGEVFKMLRRYKAKVSSLASSTSSDI